MDLSAQMLDSQIYLKQQIIIFWLFFLMLYLIGCGYFYMADIITMFGAIISGVAGFIIYMFIAGLSTNLLD